MNATLPKPIRRLLWLVCLLSLSPDAMAAPPPIPISINGKGVVCKNAVTACSLAGTPSAGISYSWTMSNALGTFSNAYGTTTTVAWAAAGTTVITLQGKTSAGWVIEQGTLTVTVQPLPQPTIWTSYRVACQTFPDDTLQDHGGPPQGTGPLFDDKGCPKVCEGSTVLYTANGDPGSSFIWTVSGGIANPSGNSCVVQWGGVGMGSISVKEITADSCEGSRSVCIEIIGRPRAKFGAMPDTTLSSILACKGDNVVFVNHSGATGASPIVNWYWDFGDGSTFSSSAATNPTHKYTAAGNYLAYLVAKNACNCTDTAILEINVSEMEGVEISCPGVVCENDTANYNLDNPPSCGSYDWSVTGGSITSPIPYGTSINVVWDKVDDDGFGYVHFDASSCGGVCAGVTTLKIPVVKSIGKIKGDQYVCGNSVYKYTLPAWPGVFFNWSFSNPTHGYLSHTDQPNEIALHTTLAGGTATLHCDYYDSLIGCGGIADLSITILDADSIAGPTPVCLNSTHTYWLFNSHSGDWTLTAPDGTLTSYTATSSISPSFSQAGTYSLFVKGATFCSPPALQIKVFDLPPAPDSISGPDTICLNQPFEYTAFNALPGTAFDWTVSGGTITGPASGKTVTVQFTSPAGPYSITATRRLTQPPYCAGPALSKTLYQPHVVLAITGEDTVCPNSVQAYSPGYAFGEAYEWRISNPQLGSIDNNKAQNINVSWNNVSSPSTAVLTLRVTRCGFVYSQNFSVFIQPVPQMALVADDSVCRDGKLPAKVVVPPSTNPIGPGEAVWSATLDWSPLGSSATGPVSVPPGTATNTYGFHTISSGNLVETISVKVSNPNGCPGFQTLTKNVIIRPAPVALVTPLGPLVRCNGFTDTLTATLQSGAGSTAWLQWYTPQGSLTPCTPPFPCDPLTTNDVNYGWGDYSVIAMGDNGCPDTSNVVSIIKSCGGPGDTTYCLPDPVPTITMAAGNNCGHVTVALAYSTAGYVSGPLFNSPPYAHNVSGGGSSGAAQLSCDFDAAGFYSFFADLNYSDAGGNPCMQRTYASVTVPFVPGLVYKLSCANGAGYSIVLQDHSTYVPGVAATYYYKVDGGSWVSTAGGSYNYGSISPGPHTLYLDVDYTYTDPDGNVSYGHCGYSLPITVPPVPAASFTTGPTVPACVYDRSILFNNTSVGANNYFWDFGDVSTITLQSPVKTYAASGVDTVKLYISNDYGCTDTAVQSVRIVDKTMDGLLTATPATICEGALSMLQFRVTAGLPMTYEWMNDLTSLYTTTSGTFYVGNSGGYWVRLTDKYGCKLDAPDPNRVNVSVLHVPDAVITGDSLQCAGGTFTLYGYAGSDPAITYAWSRNGVPMGLSTPEITETGLAAGTYQYVLTVSISSGGTSCSKTSAPFTVQVHNPPAPPAVVFSVTSCEPYTVSLDVSSFQPGSYNWSNGSSGTPVTAYEGGPYKVWYTDLYGCTVSAEAYVPKDPRGYLWIFPTGCYLVCPPVSVPGPIIAFESWNYYDASGILLSGARSIPPPLTLSASGLYGMFLDNGWCQAQTDTLDLTLKDSCGNCAGITAGLVIEYDPTCMVLPYFSFSNTTGSPVSYTITSNIGTMAPPNNMGTLPPGVTGFSDRWIPPAGFISGNVSFTVTILMPDGSTCTFHFTRYVACPHGGPVHRMTHNGGGGIRLSLAPNPAQGGTAVFFEYGSKGEGAARSLALYDLAGRRLAAFEPGDGAAGVWNLSVADLAAGTYQVVMKEGGRVLAAERLIISR